MNMLRARPVFAVSVVSLSVTAATPVSASIIGDVVDIAHRWPDHNTYWDGPHLVTVALGNSDATAISPFADHHPGYTVNVEADRILIDFTDNVTFNAPGSFHGVVIASIDDVSNPAWQITSAVYAPGSATSGILTFAPHEVSINWFGNSVSAGAHYEVIFGPVPAPGAAVMMIGALPFLRRRRR